MSSLRPSADEERWLALAARLPSVHDARSIAESSGHWKTIGWMKRSALFLLGIVCAALTYIVLELMHLPGAPWICAALLLGAAEWLIVGRRLFGCGIEELLEAASLVIVAIFAVDFWHGRHDSMTLLLIAVAFALAGLRLLNPLFSTVSVISLSAAIHEFIVQQGHSSPSAAAWLSGGLCFVVGTAALAGCMIEFRRPSYDRMVDWLVVAMPVCGYLWIGVGGSAPSSVWLTAALLLAFGGAALAVGVRARLHAPLGAFMLCAGCLAYELRRISSLSVQERLLLGGGAVLLIAVALDRYLREPRRGITSRQLETDDSLDPLQLAGTLALAPHGPAGPDGFKGGGGTSSGGGASGNY
jgi:hypothetical protein